MNAWTSGGTPELRLDSGRIIHLVLAGASPEIGGTYDCTETFDVFAVSDTPDSGAGNLTSDIRITAPDGTHVAGLQFPSAASPPADPDLDGTIEIDARINEDGSFQAVSRLGKPTTAMPTPANMQGQIAIYGHL
jgi:hypothetical protein